MALCHNVQKGEPGMSELDNVLAQLEDIQSGGLSSCEYDSMAEWMYEHGLCNMYTCQFFRTEC